MSCLVGVNVKFLSQFNVKLLTHQPTPANHLKSENIFLYGFLSTADEESILRRDWKHLLCKTERRETELESDLTLTFVARLELQLSSVIAVAAVGTSANSKHVNGAWLQPLHCHNVGFGL